MQPVFSFRKYNALKFQRDNKNLRASEMSHFTKKRKLDKNVQDNLYFDSYSDITIHEEMIADTARTNTYRTGVLRNSSSIQSKVVLDVGEGSGVSLPKPGPGKFTRWRLVQSLIDL